MQHIEMIILFIISLIGIVFIYLPSRKHPTYFEVDDKKEKIIIYVWSVSRIKAGGYSEFVYEKTETIWLPSLMHGATNAFTIFAYLIKPDYSNMAILGPAYIGIISMIPMMIAAVIICVKKPRKKEGGHYVTYQ